MKGFVEMSIAILPSGGAITINAELRSHDDVAEFVALFNPAVEQVFPAPADAEGESEGEDASEGETA